MGSINVFVYSARNEKTQIKMRFCPPCHKAKIEELDELAWVDELKMEHEIWVDPELASKSSVQLDDSEDGMRRAGKITDSVPATN